jgi:predicted glycoside hydrolase/deacetylase ChbG (UPF0249 family)
MTTSPRMGVRRAAIGLVALLAGASAYAAASLETGSTGHGSAGLSARLGYAAADRLLIVHGDDFGEWHAVNTATIEALGSGSLSSASLMVPCPWFPEAAAYARAHPDADLGLHLTLTSERVTSRWGPVIRTSSVPTLLDAFGYFHRSPSALLPQVEVREAEAELRAQIEHALASGVRPTHLDSHQGTLYSTRPLFETLLKLGREYGIPVMVSRTPGHGAERLAEIEHLPSHAVVVDRISIRPGTSPSRWSATYLEALRKTRPGVLTQMVVHLGHASEEMRAATAERETWGADWRKRDYDFVTSEGFRQLLRGLDIKLVTWREVGRALGLGTPASDTSPGIRSGTAAAARKKAR